MKCFFAIMFIACSCNAKGGQKDQNLDNMLVLNSTVAIVDL